MGTAVPLTGSLQVTSAHRFEFDHRGFLHLRGVLTPEELEEYGQWMKESEGFDVKKMPGNTIEALKAQGNRPVSRIFDADPRFLRFLDHAGVEPFLAEIAIAACDLAEVIGMAIGLQLLFGMDLMTGVIISIADTLLLFFLIRKSRRFAATTWFMPAQERKAETSRGRPSSCWIPPAPFAG